jgi:NAD(P)H-flavin reductase
MEFAKPQKFTAIVLSKEKISAKVYLVRFSVPLTFTFIAGQTVMMYVTPGVNRVMSLSSSPFETGYIEMIHDVSPGGPGSQWTMGAKIGDTIQMMGPLGRFVLAENDLPKVFIATGSGVAPYYSILHQLHHDGKNISIKLYWGLRFEEDIFWQKEFEQMTRDFPEFYFLLTLSQSSLTWAGDRGHVTEDVIKNIEIHRLSEFYLCGNQKMVREMTEQLLSNNIEKSRIYSELFF